MKKQTLTSEKRLVFKSGGGPGSLGGGSGVEKVQEWRNVDAMAAYKTSMEATLSDLANNANPDNPKEYASRIKNSLKNYLTEGKTLDDLWSYLEQENCKYLAIIKGLLNFYRAKDDVIDIKNLFTLHVPAESPEEMELAAKRKDVFSETAKQLAELKAELSA